MFKPRHYVPILFLLLSAGCASAGTPTPTTPPITPTKTLMPPTPTPTTPPIAPTTTLTPPTPTSPLPTPTSPQPIDHGVGLIAYSSDQDGDFEIWGMMADGSDPHKLTDNNAMGT